MDGEPVQEIVPAKKAAMELLLVCLAGLHPARREAEAKRLSREATRQPFDLGSEAPLRPLLIHREPRSHDLLLTLHHIAADEDSLTLLARELATLYGAPPGAPALLSCRCAMSTSPSGTGRVARRGARTATGVVAGPVADLPTVELPADRPRKAVRSSEGAVATSIVLEALATALGALDRREGAPSS